MKLERPRIEMKKHIFSACSFMINLCNPNIETIISRSEFDSDVII